MKKPLSPSLHLYVDTTLSVLLILAPLFVSLGFLAQTLSQAGGAFLLLYNNLTQRKFALFGVFGEGIHHALDLAGIAALWILPWFLFSGFDRYYFLGFAVLTSVLYLLTSFEQEAVAPLSLKLRVRYFMVRALTGAFISIPILFIAGILLGE